MKNFSIIAVVVVVFLAFSSLFVVKEGERGIVIQFGKVKRDSDQVTRVYEPGLHFKLPIFDSVRIIDARN
jgi:membrane protease subunit HflC